MDHAAPDRFATSRALMERSRRVLAGGISSQFRAYTAFHPMFYDRAQGARVWDVDGNALLDFTLSQGPMIVGHSNPEVIARVTEAVSRAQLFAGQHEAELALAETLQRLIPCAERIRFASSGSEAAHACLRLARHVTGKPKWIKFEGHYHGWLDQVSWNVTPPPPGANDTGDALDPVPWCGGVAESTAADVVVLPWNDLDRVARVLEKQGHEIGALITEPVMCNQGCNEPLPGFLQGLRDLCNKHGVALIFDEIITGFRIDLGGAQSHYGVTPDLALFGKALGSGFPIAAIAGRHRFMAPLEEGGAYHAGTMNGNNACVAAAQATLDVLERDDRAAHRRIVALGTRLRDGLAEAGAASGLNFRTQGPGPMFWAGFSDVPRLLNARHVGATDKALGGDFAARLLLESVRIIERGLWYVSAAHTEEDVEAALAAARRVLTAMAAAR
ncbi:aspartate aminotransferase family protein [Muricoccus radiodurans]|uniref:aspartate aminotransferase family protein n=1 Tax=Muricoccus radiodurans TaxID=2231721 RepID=UPI003CEE5F27